MANANAPFGFQHIGGVGGNALNFGQNTRLIASTYTTPIYFGDAVVPVTSTATGYIAQATASTVALAGIFIGCQYLSVSTGRLINSRYWPGSDANGDVTAYVIDDPQARFRVQADSTGLPFAKIGQNVQLNVGSGGSTATGMSGMYVSGTPGTTSTYPFILVGLDPAGTAGTDATLGYNVVTVQFNNEIFKTGITGIS
jgi:hypothetical protein